MYFWALLGVAVFIASHAAFISFKQAYTTTREFGCFLIAFATFVESLSIFTLIWFGFQMILSGNNYSAIIFTALICIGVTLLVKMAAKTMKKTEGLN